MSNADQTSTVDSDLLCVRCQYNLRTIPLTGQCPECGESVQHTVQAGDWVSDAAWCAAIRAGLALYPIAMVASIQAYTSNVIHRLIYSLPITLLGYVGLVELFLLVLPLALFLMSVWLMTTPRRLADGAVVPGPRAERLRWVAVTYCVLATVRAVLINQVILEPGAMPSLTLRVVLEVINIFWLWLFWQRVADLLASINGGWITRHARGLAWMRSGGAALQVAIPLAVLAFFLAIRSPVATGAMHAAGIAGAVLAGAGYVLGAWGFMLLLMSRRRLARLMPVPAGYLADAFRGPAMLVRWLGGRVQRAVKSASYHGPPAE